VSFSIDLESPNVVAQANARRTSHVALQAAVLAHLTLDLVLVLGRWSFGPVAVAAVAAVPLAQAGLAAIWSCAAPVPSYARFLIATAATAWAWFVAVAVLPAVAMPGAASAAWAVAFATQTAVILAAVALCSIWRQVRPPRDPGADGRPATSLQYGVGSLLAWTTAVALLLGLWQTASAVFGWHANVVEWPFFRLLPVIGIFSAVYTLLVVLSLARRRWIAARVLAAAGTIAALAYFLPDALAWLFVDTGGLSHTSAMVMAGTQTALLYLTLFCVPAGQRWQ